MKRTNEPLRGFAARRWQRASTKQSPAFNCGVSTKEKRFAAELMHQQCWCWGRDILTRENLLLRFGFARHRPPACPGATRYALSLADGTRLALWGFGLWLGLPDGTQGFFSRYRRGVWLLPATFDVSSVHAADAVLRHLRRPAPGRECAVALRLARTAAQWCESYERWVAAQEGLGHRRATLRKWEHPLVDADEMPAAWRSVIAIYDRWYRKGEQTDAIGNLLARLHDRHPHVAG